MVVTRWLATKPSVESLPNTLQPLVSVVIMAAESLSIISVSYI